MKLSIIIPVYRTQDTLDRCLQSILQQSFTDYEIILIDDGSPDECPQLCDKYALQNHHIHVIHKENGGLSDARNVGIKKAEGDYITFVDSDDTLQKETLSLLMQELTTYTDIDILEYPVLERYGHSKKENLLSFSPHEYSNPIEYWLREKAYNHTYAWNKIYNRNLFKYISFPKGHTFEDVQTIPYLIVLIPIKNHPISAKIKVTNIGCYIYHWNEKGITANAKYEDLYHLYQGYSLSLEYILRKIHYKNDILIKYQHPLEDFMAKILNVLLDLYELSGKYEVSPPLINTVGKLNKILTIKSLKLNLLNILGYHTLCKLNKLIHKIHKHH